MAEAGYSDSRVDVIESSFGERVRGRFGLFECGLNLVLHALVHGLLGRIVQQIVRTQVALEDVDGIVLPRLRALIFRPIPTVVVV